VPAVAALVLLIPASILPARAQAAEAAQRATISESAKSDTTQSDRVKPPAAQTTGATGAGNVAAVDQANPSQQKSFTANAIEKVKEVAKSAATFQPRPCLPPKGGAKSIGSLPHVASKLASGESVVIVAFGSSSTAGTGTTSPEFTYPNRLAAQVAPAISDRRHYRHQSRPGRRRRARNDEAPADGRARHETGIS